MFQQYAEILRSEIPHLDILGRTYPPPHINLVLSNMVFVLRMVSLLVLFAGPHVFPVIGLQNPPWVYTWAQENKVQSSCMGVLFCLKPTVVTMCVFLRFAFFFSPSLSLCPSLLPLPPSLHVSRCLCSCVHTQCYTQFLPDLTFDLDGVIC